MKTCGMCSSAITQVTRFSGTHPQSLIIVVGEVIISKRLDTIVEFSAFGDFISFKKKGKNKVKRTQNRKIKVTIEADMVCGVV